jgi:putative DNA-invertase from lambdoid prophage Rac
MCVINAVAEFERDLPIERTQAGLARARAEGKAIGRPASLTPERLLREGQDASAVARAQGQPEVSRTAIRRVKEALSVARDPLP